MKKVFIILLMTPLCSLAQIFEGNYIKAKATGGTPPYTHSLNGITYQSLDTFYNLVPGSYTVYTKDSKNCINVTNCTLYKPVGLIQVSVTRNSITVQGVDGVAPYRYSRNSTTKYQTSNRFTELRSRTTYTIRVRDNANYVKSLTITTL